MIEYAIWPGDLDHWDGTHDHCFYLEVFGETNPQLTPAYVQAPGPAESQPPGTSPAPPLYEYYWSLGYLDLDGNCGPSAWGGELADTAAEVYLYFPTAGGWRAEEMLATIKYLCPGREHASILQDAAHMFSTVQPIVEDASKLAEVGAVLPGVGPVAASTARLLDTITRLKITSVPPTDGYEWYVQKVSQHVPGQGLILGVKWTISKKLFVEFGSRLTGSIAVNIVPARRQPAPDAPDSFRPGRQPVRAKAVMHLHPDRGRNDSPRHIPDEDYLELEIEPQ